MQAGHGRREIAAAATPQAEELAFFPVWGFAHPKAVALAERLTSLAPDGLSRVFFTSGGSEAVESAWKLARQHFVLSGQPERYKVIARRSAYHGTTLGALAINGVEPLEAAVPAAAQPGGRRATRRRRTVAGASSAAHLDACSARAAPTTSSA